MDNVVIKAVIFDFDDVIIRTEKLKALSYVRAIEKLCNERISKNYLLQKCYSLIKETEDECPLYPCPSQKKVVEAYKVSSGRSRKDMATKLVKTFSLEKSLEPIMKKHGLNEPWEALIKVRMPIYEEVLQNRKLLRESLIEQNVALLYYVKGRGFKTALATMSERRHVLRIIEGIGLEGYFDEVVTGEDVSKGKPAPEIYLLTARRLGLKTEDCLVIEDSLFGVQAAVVAGMKVIAVPTDISRERIEESGIIDKKWIVTEPEKIIEFFNGML